MQARRIESCEACEGTGMELASLHWTRKPCECRVCDGTGVQWATPAPNEREASTE